MPLRHMILSAILGTVPVAMLAAPVTIVPRLHGASGVPAENVKVVIRAMRRANHVDLAQPSAAVALRADESGLVNLPAGQWSLDAELPGYWHARQFFVTDGSRPADITADMWRSGSITGNVAVEDGTIPPRITIRFADSKRADGIRGESACPVADGRFTCAVPTGLLDLRIRATGCIARYVWEQAIAPDAVVDTGATKFKRGASIVGAIALGGGVAAKMDAVRVRAVPDAVAASRMAAIVVTPEAKGLFHIDGVAPGTYDVVAVAPHGATSLTMRVIVRGTAEAQIGPTLVVERPRMLTVDFLPLLDPRQRPWVVTLDRDVNGRVMDHVTQGSAANGTWSATLIPGRYRLTVGTADGATWETHDVRIERDERMAITLMPRKVHGTVTLGHTPIAARLVFGGVFSTVKLATESGEDGRFALDLPRTDSGKWTVSVVCEKPQVKKDVVVTMPDNGNDAIDIKLPNTIITGTVTDEEGHRVKNAILNVTSGSDLVQASPADDGTFAIHGLDPGKYTIEADAFLQQSDPMDVTIGDDGTSDDLSLVLRPVRKVIGEVLSDAGPIPGSDVTITPTDVSALVIMTAHTDERGVFSAIVPHACREADVTVGAPGFAYKAFHTPLRDGTMIIHVDQRGGTLAARWPNGAGRPVLIHSGALLWPDVLAHRWGCDIHGAEENTVFTTAPLDGGTYSLCVVKESDNGALRNLVAGAATDTRCVTAFLAPFGDISLDATVH